MKNLILAAMIAAPFAAHATSDIDVLRKNMEAQKNEALTYSNQIQKRAMMNTKNITELQIKKVNVTTYESGQARQDKALEEETVARIEGDKRNDKALAGKVDVSTYEGDRVSVSNAIQAAAGEAASKVDVGTYQSDKSATQHAIADNVAQTSTKVSQDVYRDAQAGQQRINQSLAASSADTNARIDKTDSAVANLASTSNRKFSQLKAEVDKNKRRADAGIAGVAAMASIPNLVNGQHFSVGAGVGMRGGQQALAVGVSAAVTDRTTVKLSVAADTGHSFTAGAGVAYGW